MVLCLATQLFQSTLWLFLLVLHEVLLHGFPSPSPSFPLSLQFFHAIVVKKIATICGFHSLTTWRPTQQFDVQTTNANDKMKKFHVKCSSLFILCHKRVCIEKGYLRWLGHWLIIWHPLVKIDKLPTLVGAKMYTFARFYLCNVSLSFHIIYCC
jgi:hypothetical protein